MPEGDLQVFVADLHIHSVLSPCAQREMLPQCIILEALEKKIDMIALCDHNACDNVEVTVALGNRFGIWVIPSIEVETREEVHLLCYFPTVLQLQNFNHLVSASLLPMPLREDIWGEEWVIGEDGQVSEKKAHLLTYPTTLSVEEVVTLVRTFGGVVVPAHVDRKHYSIVSQLGFIPPDLMIPAVEISQRAPWKEVAEQLGLQRFQVLCSSDAHQLSEIGLGKTYFLMYALNWSEFMLAMHGEAGRSIFLP
ncbi:MAG: PHP domain-containing protein [Atribacterota bacterium]